MAAQRARISPALLLLALAAAGTVSARADVAELRAICDCTVHESDPSNYCNANLIVGVFNDLRWFFYVRWDFARALLDHPCLAGATIDSVQIEVRRVCSGSSPDGMTCHVSRVTADWPCNITWPTRPPYALGSESAAPGCTDGLVWYVFEDGPDQWMRTMVQGGLADPSAAYGVAFTYEFPGSGTLYHSYRSSEQGDAPILRIEYTPAVDPLTQATATPDTICAGQSAQLCAIGGSGGTCRWYRGGCGPEGGGTALGTGECITVAPAATTTYYVRRESGGCQSDCVSATVFVVPATTAPTGAAAFPPLVCAGDPVTLTAAGGVGTTLNWYAGGCGAGPPVASGTPATVTPTGDTRYYARWESPPCEPSSCAYVDVAVVAESQAATDIIPAPGEVCAGQPVVLCAAGGGGGTPTWYLENCAAGPLATGQCLEVIAAADPTTYCVRYESDDCGDSACTCEVFAWPAGAQAVESIVADPGTVCPNECTTILTAVGGSGGTITWYAGGCGQGAPLGHGREIVVCPAATTTYWARVEPPPPCPPTECVARTVVMAPECQGACCLPSGRGCLERLSESFCVQVGGVFAGNGTSCTDVPPPCDEGACCQPGEPCAVTYRVQCAADGGSFYVGATCSPDPCPGACCYPDGSCQVTSQAECSGDWLGQDTVCAPGTCLGACCFGPALATCADQQPRGACDSVGGEWRRGATCDSDPCFGACCFGPGHIYCAPWQTAASCGSVGGQWLGPFSDCSGDPCPVVCPGDFDCDGRIDLDDIDPFVITLASQRCCDGTGANCDVNGDGRTDFDDIEPFVVLLASGASCP